MTFAAIDRRRVAWCVVVYGLPYRLCSDVAPGGDLDAGTLYEHDATEHAPADIVDAVVDVGPIEGHIDDLKAVASQSPVEVQVRAWDARTAAGARINPAETLMRVAGSPSSTYRAKLAASLEHVPASNGPVDIEIGASAAAWPLPGRVHIGQEVIWAGGYSDPGGDVHKLTGCTRGADKWATQEHAVDAARGEQPWVTSDVTAWRGRRADIFVSALDASGAAIGWKMYWAGVIDSPPTYDGRLVILRVSPLTAVMNYKLGVGSAARTATTVSGAHRFRVGTVDTIRASVRWDIGRLVLEADSADGGAGTITLTANAAAVLDSFSEGSRLHLRWWFNESSGLEWETAASYTSPTLSFVGGSPLATAVASALATRSIGIEASGIVFEHIPLVMVDPTAGADQIVPWPARLLQVINQAQTWQPGPIDSWADPTGEGGDDRISRMDLRAVDGWALLARERALGHDVIFWASGRLRIFRDARMIRAGWVIGEAVDDVRNRRNVTPNYYYELDGLITGRAEFAADPVVFVHDGPSVWFYQGGTPGEPVIGPFDADIYTGGTQQIEVRGPGDRAARLWIKGSTSGTHPATGDTVYWYEVHRHERAPNVLQMEGDSPLTAQVVAAANDTTPGDYILRLLKSGVGNGDNGASDAMPIGANVGNYVAHDAVASSTFTTMAVPPPLDGQDYEAVRGKSIVDQTEGLLLACGAQVAQVYSSSRDVWRIELVHMGPADASQSALTLTDSDLIHEDGRDPVTVDIDGRTVRSYIVRFHSRGAAEPEDVAVACTTERNAAGADDGSPLELDLPGVEVPIGTGAKTLAAAEIVADARARVSVPRVRWRLAIRADLPGSLSVGLGSVVTLTSAYAIGILPTETASSTACRVVGIRRDLMENRIDFELRPFPATVGGWAQSARVVGVVDGDTVTIAAAAFSDADIDHWTVGDKVSCVPLGNWSGRTAKTITGIDTALRRLTIVGHGLVADGLVIADDYGNAVAAQRTQAYMASANDELGSGDDARIIG